MITTTHSLKLWRASVYGRLIAQDIISYPWFSFFLESGTSYDSCLIGLFSSMWSWMSGWDPTTWKYVPTHPSNHMNLLIKPIGTCDKNLASWFELYRICFVTCLVSRFFTFLVIVDIRVSRGILKERNRWWLSHENEWSLRHLRAHLMCSRGLKLAYLVRLWFLKTPYSRE